MEYQGRGYVVWQISNNSKWLLVLDECTEVKLQCVALMDGQAGELFGKPGLQQGNQVSVQLDNMQVGAVLE